MAGGQSDQDLSVVVGHEGAVAEGEVIVRCRQADVVDDGAHLVARNHLADRVLDLLEQLFGRFDARAGRRAHMQRHLAGIDCGEVVGADKHEQDTGAGND